MAEPDHRQIYAESPARYDALVAAEDWQRRLLPAITDIARLRDAAVVEFGAGTGRLTRLLAPPARSVHAFDIAPAMLRVARRHLTRMPQVSCSLTVADNRALPLPARCADVAVAGWSFGHSTVWNSDCWHGEIRPALDEMLRVLRPGGTALILETLGLGAETPRAPTAELADYYRWLEAERGFTRRWLRTDFRFASVAGGEDLLRFFFGDAVARQLRRSGSRILPECTGIWWRRA